MGTHRSPLTRSGDSAIRVGFHDDETELEDAEAEEDVSDDVEEDAVAAE